MTANIDIVNRALQSFGSRTTVTAAELAASSTNEAIQANISLTSSRDEVLRMAPWNSATNFANLTYITSAPGTPENTSPGATLWAKGQPPPPFMYEYQYPVDCLRPLFIIPQFATGFSGGIPITTAVTGGAPAFWSGPPVRFKVGLDQFYPVTAAAVVAGGSGYVVGDIITLPIGPVTSTPIGAPVKLLVATAPGGVVATVTVVNQIIGSDTPQGGSYFARQTGTIAQDTTAGVGTGATFTLTFGAQGDQRVILTNQEFAALAYLRQITDPNVMDSLLLNAWTDYLAGNLAFALTGDKALANMQINLANNSIAEARKADGNEGLTINDVTPDWIRIRGINYPGDPAWGGPYNGFEWGNMLPLY